MAASSYPADFARDLRQESHVDTLRGGVKSLLKRCGGAASSSVDMLTPTVRSSRGAKSTVRVLRNVSRRAPTGCGKASARGASTVDMLAPSSVGQKRRCRNVSVDAHRRAQPTVGDKVRFLLQRSSDMHSRSRPVTCLARPAKVAGESLTWCCSLCHVTVSGEAGPAFRPEVNRHLQRLTPA